MAEKRQEVTDSCVNINKLVKYLKFVREEGDRVKEAKIYCILGYAYHSLGDFQKAIEYHERRLKISKEVGDRAGEGRALSLIHI